MSVTAPGVGDIVVKVIAEPKKRERSEHFPSGGQVLDKMRTWGVETVFRRMKWKRRVALVSWFSFCNVMNDGEG